MTFSRSHLNVAQSILLNVFYFEAIHNWFNHNDKVGGNVVTYAFVNHF